MRPNCVVLKSSDLPGFNSGLECCKSFADFLDLAQNHLVLSWWVRRGKHDIGRTATSVLDPC